MMSRNTNQLWFGWKILLCIHLVAYLGFFMTRFIDFNGNWYASQYNYILLLGWTILLLAHVGIHFYYTGRANQSQSERQAYRDGFADAARQFSQRPTAVDRLMLDDDESERLDIPEKRKRQL
jgi:hypothetical protein